MPMLSAVFRRACALPALMALSLLAACSSAPVAPAALYDFGLAPATSACPRLPPCAWPTWLARAGWTATPSFTASPMRKASVPTPKPTAAGWNRP